MKEDSGIPAEVRKELQEKAIAMLSRSYAPYSHFHVGAALLCRDGKIYTGCNVENAAFTPSNCAERTAVFKAVSEGEKDFAAICIAGGKDGKATEFCPPCGVCRQVLEEFCSPDGFRILLTRSDGQMKEFTLRELLPEGFGPSEIS